MRVTVVQSVELVLNPKRWDSPCCQDFGHSKLAISKLQVHARWQTQGKSCRQNIKTLKPFFSITHSSISFCSLTISGTDSNSGVTHTPPTISLTIGRSCLFSLINLSVYGFCVLLVASAYRFSLQLLLIDFVFLLITSTYRSSLLLMLMGFFVYLLIVHCRCSQILLIASAYRASVD